MNNIRFQSYDNRPKRRGFFSYFLVAILGAVIGGILVAYIAPNYLYGKVLPMPEIYQQEEIHREDPTSKIEIHPDDNISTVSAVAEKNTASVVGITTLTMERNLIWERMAEGVGSGVIVDSNGYILTNSHVINDGRAESINILFEDGETVEGEVLWFDPALDLAMIKADVKGVQAAELGDSDELKVGELAVAIGNPLGLDFQRSVTSGVISGLHRSIKVDEHNMIEDLIQTDASINPGNSGGPLLNSSGQVIGINTAKVQSGEGLGFSIPINMVKPIIEEVIDKGTYENVSIGFSGVEVEIVKRRQNLDFGVDYGIVVVELVPNSPGAYAGLKPGDVIVGIDDKKIETMSGLRKALYNYRFEDEAELKVIRNKKEMNLKVKFFEY